jgi:small subunit ribosomal protein S20
MANTKSAEKRIRQSLERRQRNRAALSRLRTEIKRIRGAVDAGDKQLATSLLPATLGLLDRSAGRKVIHRNAAARRKARLTKLVNSLEV